MTETQKSPIILPLPAPTSRACTPWFVIGLTIGTIVLLNALVVMFQPSILRVNSYDHQFTPTRISHYYDSPRPDVIFMGTSRTTAGFDPEVAESEVAALTGEQIRGLNLGMTGGTIGVNYLVLKNIITEEKKPRAIVYGVTEVELNTQNSDGPFLRPHRAFLLRPDDFATYTQLSIEDTAGFWVRQACPLCRDAELIRSGLSIAFSPFDPAHLYYAGGQGQPKRPANGFYPGPVGVRPSAEIIAMHQRAYRPLLQDYRLSYMRLMQFQQFLTLARSRQIEVVLVNMPVMPVLRELWPSDASIDRYRAAVEAIAIEHNVPYLDLYREPGEYLRPEDFVDTNHLNADGARTLTRLVARNYLARIVRPVDMSNFYAAEYSDLRLPLEMMAGSVVNGTVVLRNDSASIWPVGDVLGAVRLTYRWRDGAGTEVPGTALRSLVPVNFPPGQAQRVDLTVEAPPRPGLYTLDVELVHEGVAWFKDRGVAPITQTVTVLGPR